MYYSLGVFFFLLCLPLHACNARRLGFVAEDQIDNHADFLAQDVYKLKLHDQLKEDGIHRRRTPENLIGATMKQKLFNSLHKAKDAVEKATSSGYEINIYSGVVDLHGMAKVEGLKRVTRSRPMLGISGGNTEEDVDFKEKGDTDGDIDDVMDYSQPHRKPPIHNEKN